ncbi:hypothetical protein BG011_005887 [Mortierella polycephala]|uniref:DUF7593 domain-containing protein n=1 Tax=Mortierella polycephala TaxID=41804 RepID=A0A9P6PU86_9FUNG|nr:hypothetical protein BG011_005887 [Mortierella polycephala]
MANGKSTPRSMFSLMGTESMTAPKESGMIVSGNEIKPDLSPSPSLSPIPQLQPTAVDQERQDSTSPELAKSITPADKNIPLKNLPAAAMESVSCPIQGDQPTNVKAPASDKPKQATGAIKPSEKTASMDFMEGALSDFDGSDLSDLSSVSSASGSDQDMNEDEEGLGSGDNGDGHNEDDGDDDDHGGSADDSSVSDSPPPRSKSKQAKRVHTKSKPRSMYSRRIQSDSSDGNEEAEEPQPPKRGPGRPPKLKSNMIKARTTPSKSPVSPTFSAFAKKIAEDSSDRADAEDVMPPPATESQSRKKSKQPDFVNIGKRDRSGRTQLFKYTAIGNLETCEKLIEAGAQVNDRDHAGWTPLHEACVTGHDKVAELLIQHHADVNARGGHQDTPLHDAAQNGHVEVVKLLIAHGANVLAKNAKGITPLDVTDDKEVMDLLQRRQALINMLTGKNQAGQTLLHRACSSGSLNNVTDLLNQGADIRAQDNAQWTPLHEAALAGHTEVVELLLSRGADPNAQGHGNDTALHDASQNEHEDVVRLLLEYGADPVFKNAKGETPADVCEHDGILELLKTGARGTKGPLPRTVGPLSSSSVLSSHSSLSPKISASSKQSTIQPNGKGILKSKRLKESSVSDDGRSASEERPVHMSRDERKMQQLLSTIRMQEQMEERKKAKKRRPKRVSDDEGDDDDEHGEQASRSSKPTVSSSSFWRQSTTSNHRTKSSNSTSKPLSRSSKNVAKKSMARPQDRSSSDSEPGKMRRTKRSSLRSLLRSTGDRIRIDHRFKDSTGRTQLHQWAESGDIEMVGTLLEGGVERDPKDHVGLTPLHLAAKAGNSDVLVLLLAYGCNVNAQDQDKSTALHEAVRYHHTEAVRLLLQNNAVASLRDAKKRTSLDLASSKDPEIRSLLKASLEQAELKAKEKSKKRLSQSIESHGSPKHKERKTSRQSDSDEPTNSRKKDSGWKDIDERRKQHSRTGSSSGALSKSASMPSISMSPATTVNAPAPAVTSQSQWRGNSEVNVDDPLKKQRTHGRRLSSSGTGSNIQYTEDDVDMKDLGSNSKKRRETDRHGDAYGGKVKIKKEREEEGHHFRRPSLTNKTDELRRVASTPSLVKDNGKTSRLASKSFITSSRPLSALGMTSGSSIASISPPLTETSSSPPPVAQSSAAQELETLKTRKRSSQTFSSPSGYQKFADDLKLGSSSLQQHSRQRSTSSIPSSRSGAPDTLPTTADPDMARKKAKTSVTETIMDPIQNNRSNKETVNGSSVTVQNEVDTNGRLSARIQDLIKKEDDIVGQHTPSERSVQDAQRYLPLYTVQFSDESASTVTTAVQTTSPHFCVVDQQVQLLLGLGPHSLYSRYPHLHRRLVTKREKARLWSPLSSMVSDRCAAAVKLNYEILPAECQFSSRSTAKTAMSRLKEHEKQKFLGCELYFVRLEDVLELIRRDYGQLNESMMTIMLDISYDEELKMEDSQEDEDTVVKVEDKEETLKQVKKEEPEGPAVSRLSALPLAPVSASPSVPAIAPVAKMMRVPAKMATKAMFREMQHQYRHK